MCALQDRVNNSVNLLNHLARILRQRRIDAGALTLASPEVRFKLDSETQNPTDVAMYSLKESNALVEEWMLLANITVSKQILKFYPTLGTVTVGA
jgi:exosome complex exonuclease DIS3/RRP44